MYVRRKRNITTRKSRAGKVTFSEWRTCERDVRSVINQTRGFYFVDRPLKLSIPSRVKNVSRQPMRPVEKKDSFILVMNVSFSGRRFKFAYRKVQMIN